MVYPRAGAIPFDNPTFPSLTGQILFETNRDTNYQIYSMNGDGSSQTNQSNNSGTNNERSAFGFNGGNKIALGSDVSGNNVFVADFSLTNGITNRTVVSNETLATQPGVFAPIVTSDNSVVLWNGWDTPTSDNTRANIRARKLDNNGQPTGSIVTMATGLAANARKSQMALNADDTKLYFAVLPFGSGIWSLYVADFDKVALSLSNVTAITGGSGLVYPLPNFAEDKLICATFSGGVGDIYKYDLSGTTISNPIRLTSHSGFELALRFSLDQNNIVYVTNTDGDNEVYNRNNVNNDVIDNTVKLTNNSIVDNAPWMGTLKL
jgi:Tol biopolymer transport system component